MNRPRSLISLPAGRVAKWIVLAVWIAVAALVAPFAGQLQSVQENEAASFLPSNAESTRALELQRQLPGGDSLPVVVVYRRESGITPADRALAAGHQRTLTQGGPEGSPPVPSEDGTALLYVITLPAGDAEALSGQVDDIRDTVGRGEGDLEIRVTGPGGFLTDAVSVFEDIDTTLLLATVIVVAVLLLLTYRSPLLWLIPLLTVGLAIQLATASVYGLVKGIDLTVDGQSAQSLDLARASARDRNVVIPLVLLVVLGLLLRAVVAPLVLIVTVIVSFAAALGASAFAFDRLLGFEGADPSLPLLAFIFLVALGIDYNIFLMSRVREESERLGTHEGTLRGLAVTGGVITSAGIVLAATFSILVPALTLDIGPRIWWPSSLARAPQPSAEDFSEDSIRARSRSSSD